MISDPLAITTLIAGAAALAFALDRHVPALSKVGASLLCIVFGAVLSNTGLVPIDSVTYGVIGGPVTSLAIAWLLLSVNLADVRRAGPRVLAAFGLACLGTALGAFVAAVVFGGVFGADTWRLAGTLTGSYSGGSVNFVAVGRGLELPDRLFAGATAADNVTTGLWLGATLLLPIWLRRFYPPVPDDLGASPASGEAPEDHHPFFTRMPASTLDLALLGAVGLGLLLAAEQLGRWIPLIPSVLWLTTIALALGQLPLFQTARGALQLGNVALHLFFVVIGIFSRFSEIMTVGIEVFFFTLIVVGLQGVVVFGVGRLVRLDLGTLSVASQAAVGGPSSALAVAVSRQWQGLVLPGILIGLMGYAVGNYLGFALGYMVRAAGIGL